MKKILLLLLLLFAGMAEAQTVTIPDPVFRTMLLIADTNNSIAIGSDGTSQIKVDTNNDGQIQVSEALTVYHLNLGGGIIADMTGISAFTNLTYLDCHDNQLTTLNVNGLTNLKRLHCSGNMLTSLDVTALSNLNFLFCDMNELTSLNVAGLVNLKILSCDTNNLSSLNMTGLSTLALLICSNNQIASLSLNNMPQLAVLQCDHNQLTSLDVTNLPALTQLYCFYNLLTNLDLTTATNLTNLSCGENNIMTLNLNGLTQLSALECSYLPTNAVVNGANLNALTSFNYAGQNTTLTLNGFPNVNNLSMNLSQQNMTLNISGFNTNTNIYMLGNALTNFTVNGIGSVNLQSLYCSGNQLTNLSLNGLNGLTALNCSGNKLTSLSLNGLTALTQLDCSRNRITSLNLSNVPDLKRLDCNNNKITSLNLSNLPDLEYLDCSNHISIDIIGNQITSLDLSGLPNLKYLDCSNYGFNGTLGAAGNHITSLDVNNLTHLEQLKCNKNNIPTLVVNGLTNLTHLDCSFNLLTDLDLIGLTNLTHLDYSNNQLSNVNMTGLVNITELSCRDNAITTLNLTNMPNLTKLDCTSNLLTTLNLTGLTQITLLNCQNNQLSTLDLSAMNNLVYLNCNTNQLNNLNVSNLINLTELQCVSNQMTTLDLSSLTQLQHLNCGGNLLTNLDLLPLVNILDIFCGMNQLTSLDVSTLPNLRGLDFSWNQVASIDLSNSPNLISLVCNNNNLTALDLSNAPDLNGIYCNNNQITTLDLSNASILTDVRCQNNPFLETLFLKNGSNENYVDVSNNPALAYICADDVQLASIQTQLNSLGMTTTVSNSYCSFTPGGPHNTVTGTTIFDGNNNGCNANDPLHPNIRVDFTDGTTTGSAFTNTDGVCTFYAEAGNYTLFPNIENSGAFNISPASASISFPDNNYNISNQSFCLSPNGVHPDVEVVITPIGPARPGFDAYYKIVYKNKGNQSLSGNIAFTFEDDKLDLIAALPAADTEAAGSLSWAYNGLLPFESRSVELTLNVNSPLETPAVNNGDILNFDVSITPVAGDETVPDNDFSLNQTVVNSFDPNAKTCLEGDVVSPAEIGNYLHYNIEFENLGTAAAENVVVQDFIDPTMYDISTLQVLYSSHPMRAVIRNNVAEFVFENIDLAPAAGDPPVGGHGNVLFKIKTRNTLVDGSEVSNTANIFFDYNAPIETDPERTLFQALSNPGVGIDKSVTVHPNPAHSILNINSNTAIRSLSLYDIQGRILETTLENANTAQMDISNRQSGLYFLKITTESGIKVEKVVKE